ncbi:MAG: FtsX-like permease family protein [Acidobacteriota bacterium]|nr:FtsX-like permease family protein [Acidobacteriota bacterium]MDH3784501.1 FtsX-like permease family protein [Acidobacteriota bacterium]
MIKNYLKIAIKVLMRRKFYTLVSLFGISFTLLILNVAVAFMDNFFSSDSPESRLDRVLSIEHARMYGESWSTSGSPGFALLEKYAQDLPGVEKMSISTRQQPVTAFVKGEKLQPSMRRTDANYWEILDFEFVSGAPYTASDVDAGNSLAVINQATETRFFDGKPALGEVLRVDNQAFTVVGVVRDVGYMRALAFSEIWVPLTTAKSTAYRERLRGGMVGILLVDHPSSFAGVKEEFASRLADAELPDPVKFHSLEASAFTRFEHVASEFLDSRFEDPSTGLMALIFSFGGLLFMLLPALNLVNLSLSRILERASEIGVRKAFGASSWTLVGQFLTESIVLTMLGALIALGLSAVALPLISSLDAIPYVDLTFNLRAFLYGLLVALMFAIVSGTYPAWRMSRMHPVQALHGRSA